MELVYFSEQRIFKNKVKRMLREQRKIIHNELPLARVIHVGATSIEGLKTKGDLDVNVRVKKKDFTNSSAILSVLYKINQPNNWTKTFASFKDDTNLPLPFGVQLTAIGGNEDNFVLVRDLLRRHKALRLELNSLKDRYDGKSMVAYRRAKGLFIERLLKTRRGEFNSPMPQ